MNKSRRPGRVDVEKAAGIACMIANVVINLISALNCRALAQM